MQIIIFTQIWEKNISYFIISKLVVAFQSHKKLNASCKGILLKIKDVMGMEEVILYSGKVHNLENKQWMFKEILQSTGKKKVNKLQWW